MIRNLIPFLRPYRFSLFGYAGAMILSACFAVCGPYLLKIGIDHYMLKGDFAGLKTIALLFLLSVVLEYIARSIMTYGLQKVGTQLIGTLRQSIYEKLLHFKLSYFDQRQSGVLLARTVSDAESLGETLASGVASIFLDILTILSTLAVMISLSPRLSLFLLATVPLFWIIIRWFSQHLKHTFTEVRHFNGEIGGFLNESLAGLSVIKLFQKEEKRIATFAELNQKYCAATVKSNVYDASLYALMEGLAAFAIGAFFLLAGWPSLIGAVSIGLLVAFVEYLGRIFLPIKEFSAKMAMIERARVDLDRIFSILKEEETEVDGERSLPNIREGIRFENVSFRYREDAEWVLRDISFTIRRGEKLAIVGPTGSGKTTLIKLLLKFYLHYEGNITVDGIELRQLKRRDLARCFSLVAQDVFLFAGSIEENITLGREGINRQRVEWAAKLAMLDDFISKFPNTYDHHVRERGENISSGEAELLSFARALAGDAEIAILDEATAQIDSDTEKKIEEATLHILAEKTTIAIAHRLSTLTHVDRILVLKDGRIAEIGTHAELIEKRGVYYELYSTTQPKKDNETGQHEL